MQILKLIAELQYNFNSLIIKAINFNENTNFNSHGLISYRLNYNS